MKKFLSDKKSAAQIFLDAFPEWIAPSKRRHRHYSQHAENLESRLLLSGAGQTETSEDGLSEVATATTEIWVDQAFNGSTSSGTESSPFTTISDALSVAEPGTTIWVNEGTYREEVRVGSDITLRSIPGERVIISGMDQLTGWQPIGNGVYETIITWKPESLYSDGELLTRSRYPDDGWWLVDSASETSFTDSALIGLNESELVGSDFYVWTQQSNIQFTVAITGFDSSTGTVEFDQPTNGMRIQSADRYYLTGAPEHVSQVGEWTYEEVTGGYRVVYKPASSTELENVESERRRRILAIEHAQNVVLDGLEFHGAAWSAVEVNKSSEVEISNSVFVRNSYAGISIRESSNVLFRNNLSNWNGYGLLVTTGTNIEARNNEIGYNRLDGIVISYNSDSISLHQNYIHHHFEAGHPDGIQTFRGVTNLSVTSNLMIANAQSFHLQETDQVLLRDNIIIGSTFNAITLGHGNTTNVTIENNTLAYAGLGLVNFTASGYSVNNNILMTGTEKPVFSINGIEDYTADTNLFWNSDRAINPHIIRDDAGWHRDFEQYQSTTTNDVNSVYESPNFASAPLVVDSVDVGRLGEMTTTFLPLWDKGVLFEVGDYVEVNFDGVARQVVEITNNGIVLSNALDQIPFGNVTISNWGTQTNYQWDLSRTGSSNLGSPIDFARYQALDFNGDGVRDVPEFGNFSEPPPPPQENLPPSINFVQQVHSIPEDTVIDSPLRIGTFSISDDGVGENLVSLVGSSQFEIIGNGLYLKAGTVLDYETSQRLYSTIQVNDPTVGGDVDDSFALQVDVLDVNEDPQPPPPPNQEPSISFVQEVTAIPENTVINSPLRVGTFSISDDGVGENLVSLIGSSQFEIIDNGLYLKAGTVLDYETAQRLYSTIQVNDPTVGGDVDDSFALQVDVLDVNEDPPIQNDPPTINFVQEVTELPENTVIDNPLRIGTFSITDDGIGENIISLSGSNHFEIIGSGLYLKAGTVLDYEIARRLFATIEVNDPTVGGSVDDSAALHLDVLEVTVDPPPPQNQAPSITFFQELTEIPENTVINTPMRIGTFSIIDDGLGENVISLTGSSQFEIIGDGLYLKAGTVLDHETSQRLFSTIQVNDPTVGGDVDDSVAIHVDVLDTHEDPPTPQNEAPVINDQTFAVQTRSGNGTLVGIVQASDPDSEDSASTLTYEIVSATVSGAFEVNLRNGDLKVRRSRRIRTTGTHTIVIRVTDAGSPALSSEATITVHVLDEISHGTLGIESLINSLDENTDRPTRTHVAELSHVHFGLESYRFALTGADANLFEVEGTSLYLKAGAGFDYETSRSLDVEVLVLTEAGQDTGVSQSFQIMITDVNEAPSGIELQNLVSSIAESGNIDSRQVIADIVLIGDTLGQHEFSLTGDDAGKFEIEGFQLFLKAGATLDATLNPTLDVTVTVTDVNAAGDPVSSSLSILVLVMPDIQDSTFEIESRSSSGTVVGQILDEEHDTSQQYSFEIVSGDSDAFEIDPETGELTVKRRRAIRKTGLYEIVVRFADQIFQEIWGDIVVQINVV